MSKKLIAINEYLDLYLYPDLKNIVIDYLKCSKCKTLQEGITKCQCGKYMCHCNPLCFCPTCDKIVCNICYLNNHCCKNQNYSISCSYCSKSYSLTKKLTYNSHVCIFDKCKTHMCIKCWDKHKSLCRSHRLLRIYKPYHSEFEGIIGL